MLCIYMQRTILSAITITPKSNEFFFISYLNLNETKKLPLHLTWHDAIVAFDHCALVCKILQPENVKAHTSNYLTFH